MNTTNHKSEFEAQGYTVYRNFFSDAEISVLIDQIRHSEPNDPRPGTLDKSRLRFYTNVFHKSPYLQAFISQQRLVDLLSQVVGPHLWARWDQAVEKAPGGETFPWHQDNGYNGLLDGHFQLWIALSDMTQENGGLWLQPGSHKHGPLPHERIGNHLVCNTTPEDVKFVEARRGDAVLFSSLTLHMTTPNVSNGARWAYVIEYMKLDQYDPYIKAPYFVVARNARSTPEFVHFYRGNLNPLNHLRYWVHRARKLPSMIAHRLKHNPLFRFNTCL